MLQRHHERAFQNLSVELEEPHQWKPNELKRLYFPKDYTAFEYEPVTGLLAIGTARGSIHIFGKPSVHVLLALGSDVPVKFLVISVSTSRLVCMDANNELSIWDLSTADHPQFLARARFDQTNCITTSPSHSHVFLASHTGEVKTYDILCLRKSPYTLPNLWDVYKKKVGWASKENEQSARTSVQVLAHPRDLNLLFVAYAGGVVLSDLTQRSIISSYEYTIPPGAPGGAGFASHPSVTCMAIHPSGHFFAVGYTDGSLAFWAVEDDDQPLFVKTLDSDDVNVVDVKKLDQLLSNPGQLGVQNNREPIFKLSWSGFPNSTDPRGGKTVFTVLGGLTATESSGLTIFELPAFHPPDPPATDISKTLHPYFRNAMRESLSPLKTYFYATQDVVQDYTLVPRDNPHYSGTFDPIAIIFMTGSDQTTRCLSAFEFPPPAFKDVESDEPQNTEASVDSNRLANELEDTLRFLMESSEPQRLKTPFPVWIGAAGLIDAQLLIVDRPSYEALTAHSTLEVPRLNLAGGDAWADASKENDLTFAKYQPHRIMASYNLDGTVQFFDISAQLLSVQIAENLRPKALKHEFPNTLSALTVDINNIYEDPQMASLLGLGTEKLPRITLLAFAPQCACVIAVESGDVMIFRMRTSTIVNPCHCKELPDPELIPMDHIQVTHGKQLEPHLMVRHVSGRVEASSIADIGLLAISYSTGTFIVVDLTSSKIVFRKQQRKKSRHSINLHLVTDNPVDPVVDFVWTTCSIGKDPQIRVRLLAIHLSGHTDIISFTQVLDTAAWSVLGDVINTEAISNPLQHGNFVIDEKTGTILTPDRGRIFLSQNASNSESRSIFVTTGTKGARTYAEINGPRIAKVDWGSSKMGNVQRTQIVEKMGSHALVAFTTKHQAHVYSLPHLNHLLTQELPPIPSLPPSIDRSGDFIGFLPHPMSGQIDEAVYGTLFDFRRVYSSPDVELIPSPPRIPSQPQPVPVGPSSLLSAWFRFGLSMSGDQLDTLLGGPERPIPESSARVSEKTGEGESSVAAMASRAAAMHNELYGKLSSALGERGQLLDSLGERFNALEEGSRSMVAQAKKMAAQQSAKSWLGF